MLEAVDKVGGIEKAEGHRVEIVLLFEVGDGFFDELDSVTGRDDDRDPAREIVVLQKLSLGCFS